MADLTRRVQVRIGSDVSGLTRGTRQAENDLDRLGRSLKRLGRGTAKIGLNLAKGLGLAGAAGLAVAGAGLVKFVKDANTAAREAQLADRRLGQIFKTTGLSAARLNAAVRKAGNLSEAIGVDDDDIKGVQALLATFKSASKDVSTFNRATALAFDLQAAGFGSAANNAKQLGKALEDPTKGMTALAKSGVTFTKAEKEKIKALQESGDLLAAQEVILKAVEGQVGGTAAATATAADKLKQAWDGVLTVFGTGFTDDLDRSFDSVRKLISDPAVTASLERLGDAFGDFISEVTGGAAGKIDADKVAGFLDRISEALPGLPEKIHDLAVSVGEFFDAAKQATAPAAGGTWTVISSLGDALASLPASWRDDIVKIAALLAVASKVKSLGGAVVGGLGSLFGKSGVLSSVKTMTVTAGVVNVVGGKPGAPVPTGGSKLPPAVTAAGGAALAAAAAAQVVSLFKQGEFLLEGGSRGGRRGGRTAPGGLAADEQRVPLTPYVDKRTKDQSQAELDELAKRRDAKVVATLDSAVAVGELDKATRDRIVKVLADAETAQAAGEIDGVTQDRIVRLLADAKVAEAEALLNYTTRNRVVDVSVNVVNGKQIFTRGGGLSSEGGRMAGGPVVGGRAYTVGERGPEAFFPGVSGYVQARHTTEQVVGRLLDAYGRSETNVSVRVYVDGDEVRAKVRTDVERAVRGALRAEREAVA